MKDCSIYYLNERKNLEGLSPQERLDSVLPVLKDFLREVFSRPKEETESIWIHFEANNRPLYMSEEPSGE